MRQFEQHRHEDDAPRASGSVFTLPQHAIAVRYANSVAGALTLPGLMRAFSVAGHSADSLPTRQVLSDYIKRTNKQRRLATKRIITLHTHAQED